MAIIKGQNLRIKANGKVIACATNCQVHVAQTLEDASTKDSTGDWTQQEITGMAWDFSADALYSVDTDATGNNADDAMDLVLNKQLVEIEFERTQGEKNRVAAGGTKYSGNAWINDISITAGNKQNASYTIQGTGDGPLAKVTA